MSKSSAIVVMLVSLLAGYLVGYIGAGGSRTLAVIPAAAIPDSSVDRYQAAVGDAPVKGDSRAKVTIVEFSDFQCPYCARAELTLGQIVRSYGKDVRLVWKNSPLPMHQNALPAAAVAMAANAAGKFWPLHDLLFKNQAALARPDLEKYAAQIGLSANLVKEALDGNKYAAAIKGDQDEAAKLGVHVAPFFFVNGRPISGAQPFETFKKVIDEELANADRALQAGVPPTAVYRALTSQARPTLVAAPALAGANRPQPPAGPAQPDPRTIYKVAVAGSPTRGPATAKVTIVQLSDFQCPFCARVEPTIAELEKEYGKDLRVVWKNNPLPMHPNAAPAAAAALAAAEQGKFWEMHDRLFADQAHLDGATYEKYAHEIGLNLPKFKAAVASNKYAAQISDDQALAQKLGAQGTPSFFINGKFIRGAQPKENFKSVIDAAIKDADAALARGIAPANLYAEVTKGGLDHVVGGAPAPDTTVYKVDAGHGPSVGPKSAPVDIVEFSDFQCPFCGRVAPTVKQIEERYRGKVRVTFRNYPLPFHEHAQLAAEAAMAANEQGKFWPMHDKMFANQQALNRADLEKYAADIGLDVGKFNADLDAGKEKASVNADVSYANSLPGGGMGTPTFFINGHKVAGAERFETFAAVIDHELKR